MNVTNRLVGKFGIVLCSALLGCTTYGQPSVSVGVSVPVPSVEVVLPGVEIRAESDFYEPLTPHGEWVVIASHGRCWRPGRVEAGWRPYCNGSWQRTEAGWYWVSDEPWAWATYHYGRWDFTEQYGWYWVPQTQWAPAWVSWHSGGGYVGWAPLYPSARFARGGSVEVDVRVISPRAFVFVKQGRFLEPIRPTTVIVNSTTIIKKTTVISNTRIVNNTVINEGPATTVIEKASRRKIQAVPVRELRQKQEAAVVAKQRTPTATSEKKTVTAPAPPQVQKPAPAPKKSKAQSETRESVPAATESKPPVRPEAKPDSNRSPTIEEPTPPKAGKQIKKQEKPSRSSDKKMQRPSREKPATSEKNRANPADKDHENKPKE